MDSYETLKNRAIDLQLEGDTDRAQQVAAQARAQKKYEELREQAIDAQLAGNAERAAELAEDARAATAPFEKGVFQDLGQGVGAGLVNIGQALVELPALGVDATLDTDYTRNVTNFFEDGKEYLNLTPTGATGKVAEGIVTFGSAAIPLVGWLGRVSAVAKGAKVVPGTSRFAKSAEKFGRTAAGKALAGNRLRLAGTTALATGAADFFIAPSTFNTVSDAFDALPDVLKTEKDTQLTGSDEAYRILRNKLRIGAEGTILGAAVETALPVIGFAARAPAYIPGFPKAAELMTRGFDALGKKLSGGSLEKYFTSAGTLPRELYEGVEDVKGFTDASTREATRRFQAYEQAVKKVVNKSKLFGRGKEGIDKAYNDLHSFLIGTLSEDRFLKEYGKEVLTAANNMRNQVDGLTDVFMRSIENTPNNVLSVEQKKALVSQFAENQNKYLRRVYELHLRPEEFVVDMKLYDKAVNEVAAIMSKTSRESPDQIRAQAVETVNTALGKQTTEAGIKLDSGLKQLNEGLKKKNKGPNGQPVPLFKIAQGMLKDRKIPKEAVTLREMMGEIKDPKEVYLRTVGDMSQTIAANQFYRMYADSSMRSLDEAVADIAAGSRPLAIDARTLSPEQADVLRNNNYVQLGELASKSELEKMTPAEQAFGGKYGVMTGAFVPSEIKDALTITARTQDPLQELLAVSLQAKGLSQMSKTVLNPLSQIRNFHSGIFMLGANGNIVRDMNLMESARLTVGRIADMEDKEFAKTFNLLQRAGIVDQNYVVNEFRDLLKEGADLKVAGKVSDGSKKVINSIPFVQPLVRGAQNVYSGTDNFWKTVGYSGEKAKYTNAIRRGIQDTTATVDDVAEELVRARIAPRANDVFGDMEFLDVLATDIVKSTMPTYSRVPETIKLIRRIPFIGNFMAFPAEIMRTTTNITRQGLRELSFKVDPNSQLFKKIGANNAAKLEKQIRAIGARRLSSYVTMAYVVPTAAQKAAMELTDFSEEQMEALKRLVPFFMKGNIVAPIRNEEVNGKPEVDYVDLTYMMPYDFMLAPARAGLQAYSETGEVGASQLKQIANAMKATMAKFSEPFAAEGLLAERFADIYVRNGETKTGATILPPLVEGANELERTTKSILHILGGFTPGAVELFYRERRGEVEPGRLLKAIRDEPGRYSEEYTTAEEAASMLTGFREMETDLATNFYYKGAEYTGLRSALVRDFTSFAGRNDVTQEQIVEKYKQSNNALRLAQSKLYADIQAAETLGLSKPQIIRQLSKDARLGKEEIKFLIRNQFRPITISKDLRDKVLAETVVKGQRRLAPELPVSELMTEYKGVYGSLLSSPFQNEAPVPEPQPSETFVSRAADAVIDTGRDVTRGLVERARTVAPSLLGGDPASQAANQEILNRRANQ